MVEGVGTGQAQESTPPNTATCDETDTQRLTLLSAYPPQAQWARLTQHPRQAPSPRTHCAESTRRVTSGGHTRAAASYLLGRTRPRPAGAPRAGPGVADRASRWSPHPRPRCPRPGRTRPQLRVGRPAQSAAGRRGAAQQARSRFGRTATTPPPPRGLWGAQIAVLSGKAR